MPCWRNVRSGRKRARNVFWLAVTCQVALRCLNHLTAALISHQLIQYEVKVMTDSFFTDAQSPGYLLNQASTLAEAREKVYADIPRIYFEGRV